MCIVAKRKERENQYVVNMANETAFNLTKFWRREMALAAAREEASCNVISSEIKLKQHMYVKWPQQTLTEMTKAESNGRQSIGNRSEAAGSGGGRK